MLKSIGRWVGLASGPGKALPSARYRSKLIARLRSEPPGRVLDGKRPQSPVLTCAGGLVLGSDVDDPMQQGV